MAAQTSHSPVHVELLPPHPGRPPRAVVTYRQQRIYAFPADAAALADEARTVLATGQEPDLERLFAVLLGVR